jgi:hypothetical protein
MRKKAHLKVSPEVKKEGHRMSADRVRERGEAMLDRTSLRLSATLLLAGQLLYIVVTQFHAGGRANNHREIFAQYASSDAWKAVHVGQFLAMTVIIAGLLGLSFAADVRTAGGTWAARGGVASAVVALALYGVLQAVDGVGNKEVDDAWVGAQPAEKAARFASAEALRWLEWGVRSYHDYALGLALLLVAAALLQSAAAPHAIVSLMGLSGIAYLVQGWIVGAEGFSGTHTIMILLAWALSLAWMTWLAVLAWRRQDPQRIQARHVGRVARQA